MFNINIINLYNIKIETLYNFRSNTFIYNNTLKNYINTYIKNRQNYNKYIQSIKHKNNLILTLDIINFLYD